MLVSSEASPLLLYVHVHVYVYHVHIHFFYSVSDCASGCSTLLVILFLARRGYSLSYLGLALLQRRALIPHPHILTSPHPHIPTSPHSPHPHIPTFPAHTNGDPSPLDQIARSCQLVCPSSNIALTTKVAWGITGFRYSWSPAGYDDFPCRPPYTCAGFAIHIRQNSCWLTSTKSRKAVSVYPKGTRLQRTQGWTIKWCPHPPNVRMLR